MTQVSEEDAKRFLESRARAQAAFNGMLAAFRRALAEADAMPRGAARRHRRKAAKAVAAYFSRARQVYGAGVDWTAELGADPADVDWLRDQVRALLKDADRWLK